MQNTLQRNLSPIISNRITTMASDKQFNNNQSIFKAIRNALCWELGLPFKSDAENFPFKPFRLLSRILYFPLTAIALPSIVTKTITTNIFAKFGIDPFRNEGMGKKFLASIVMPAINFIPNVIAYLANLPANLTTTTFELLQNKHQAEKKLRLNQQKTSNITPQTTPTTQQQNDNTSTATKPQKIEKDCVSDCCRVFRM